MPTQQTYLICHYSEIGLKGKNRSYFENKLKNNIRQSFKHFLPETIKNAVKRDARFIFELTDKGASNIDQMEIILKRQFGLAYFAFAVKVQADMEIIKETAIELLKNEPFTTFRVTTRKTNSTFPFTKQNVNEELGAEILIKLDKKVNLSFPETTCFVDILGMDAFIYIKKIQGPGGLPVGVSGKVAVMLSGGIDSPVAAYQMMKRGANPFYVHFHSVPYVSEASVEKVKELARKLRLYQPITKLYLVKFAPIQDEIVLHCEPKYRILLYRRFMMRITEEIARVEKAGALVTGESLGQVASQTMENMVCVQQSVNSLIFRPLVGMDKQEIISWARLADTYETSIQPHQDCCTLFIPDNPATKARISDLVNAESALNIETLVKEAVESAEFEIIQA